MMTKEEIEKILKEADSTLGNYTDNQIKGFAILRENIKGKNNPIHKVKKNPFTDEEFIKTNSERNRGRKHSDKTKKILSKKAKGRTHSEDAKQKIGKAHKGIPKSAEQVKKMSESNRGKKRSDDIRQKFSELKKGIPNPKTSETNKRLNSEKYLCEYCNREIGGRANYIRFHSENCKHKK
jgi:hypothetical protein